MNAFPIAAAIALAALSTPALAESFTLSTHGAWTVDFNSPDSPTDAPTCSAITGGNGAALAIFVTSEGNPAMYVLDETRDWGDATGKITIRIDRISPWTALAEADGGFLAISGTTPRGLLAEMWEGNAIRFDFSMDGTPDLTFSLKGSAAAFAALGDCRSKLGGEAS